MIHARIETPAHCEDCAGTGRVYEDNGPSSRSYVCGLCGGTGEPAHNYSPEQIEVSGLGIGGERC